MAGNKEGGLKARETNLARNPNFYRDMGRVGGRAKVPKGFALLPREVRVEAGRKGGRNGTRKGVSNAK